MALLTDLSEVAEALETKLQGAQAALGLQGIFYGDQDRIPTTPVVCIEPGQKRTDLKNAMRGVDLEFTVFFLVYGAKVASGQDNRREADEKADQIANFLNADPYLTLAGSNRLIHSYVTLIESGYSQKENVLIRSSRITWSGRSQDRLPSPS